ncbi:hypothetical protein UF75_1174 [Desulfosporosinus sp. I2]|uniref:hypothetical protein n=1 Tax=Desulfosporosinus sp. I2 TaxID=1617025 RepID=UPI0005EE6512|nr:hypothetical protein [Desulfosporosinus sp. I2]KJR48376.1 hypothetical protein UF75_1174 [Desulfosporosinus sp. I2]
MNINDHLVSEFMSEFLDMKKRMLDAQLETKHQTIAELQNIQILLAEIQQAYREEHKTFKEILTYLQNYQGIVDYQISGGKEALEEMRSLKKEVSWIANLIEPQAVPVFNNRVITDNDDRVYTNSKSYLQSLADLTTVGVVAAARIYDRHGRRSSLSTASQQDLNDGIEDELTTANRLSIVSSDANDTGNGPGIQQVIISGINDAGNRANEIVTLQGINPIITTNTWQYLDHFSNYRAGTFGGAAAGNITVSAEGRTYARIALGHYSWRSGRMYTDSTQKGYLHELTVGAIKAAVTFDLYLDPTGSYGQTLLGKASLAASNSSVEMLFPAPMVIPASGKILVKGIGLTSGAEAHCTFYLHVQPK